MVWEDLYCDKVWQFSIFLSHMNPRWKLRIAALITSTDDSQFTWLWWWLPLRLSKRQSMSPQTVLLRTTLTRTITNYRIMIWLLGSNHLHCNAYSLAGIWHNLAHGGIGILGQTWSAIWWDWCLGIWDRQPFSIFEICGMLPLIWKPKRC